MPPRIESKSDRASGSFARRVAAAERTIASRAVRIDPGQRSEKSDAPLHVETPHSTAADIRHSFNDSATSPGLPSTPPRDVPRLSGWQLVRPIGVGAFAEIHQARPAGAADDSPADYAIKLLRPHLRTDRMARALLAREAAAAASVSHPHVIALLATDLEGESPYLTLPHLPGITLGDLLRQGIRPSPAQAVWFVRQAAEGLAALHAAGWLHGDVKPSNLMVSRGGHATLLDLGFARPIGESAPSDPLPLSLAYTAPERLVEPRKVAAASDIYSLGVLLFELLVGHPPFRAADPGSLARAHLATAASDLPQVYPGATPRLTALVRRLLAKHPLRRPDSGQELLRLLVEVEIELFNERRSTISIAA